MGEEVSARADEETKPTVGNSEPAIELVICGISELVPAPEEVEKCKGRDA